MSGSGALANLPEALVPSGLVDGAVGSEGLGSVLLVQRRRECVAFCRTVSAVYALFRDRYGERESAFLATDPTGGADFYAVRRDLSLAFEAVKAEVSAALRIGPAATETAIEQAVGFVERLPRVFTLIGRNLLSPRGGMEALSRARALTGAQALEFDELLAELLTADPLALISVPALREAADHLVHEIDPVAAERRRRMVEEDRRVTFRPAEDGMAAAYALLTAHEGLELGVRVVTRYRTLIHVVVNEKTLTDPSNTDPGFLMGHGPVTAQHARDLAARDDAVLRPFGEELPATGDAESAGAAACDAAPNDAAPNDAESNGGGEPSADADADADADAASGGEPAPVTASTSPAVDADADHEPRPDHAAGAPHRVPRSVWFRATGIDLTHREPAGILLAARCCHANLPVSTDPAFASDDALASDDAPQADGTTPEPASASASEAEDPATEPFAEASPTDCDANQRGDETPAAAQGTPVPAAEQDGVALPPTGSAPRRTPFGPAAGVPRALVIAQGSNGYRFSADLTRHLTLLYPRCVFPLCTRPASRCQLDHAREYDHREPTRGGATTADNGQPLCLPHHQLKTAGLWTDAHLPDGRILGIGPTGQRIIVDPTRTVVALFPDLTRITWTTPESTPKRKSPPPGGPTRLQRERARRERLRAAHLDAVTRERDEHENVSAVEHHLDAVLAGRNPAHHPPPDEPPPF